MLICQIKIKIKQMKKIILFFAIIFSVSKTDAQSISMASISSGGDSYSSSTLRLSFTGGQVLAPIGKKHFRKIIK
jgi:hypothetical protein